MSAELTPPSSGAVQSSPDPGWYDDPQAPKGTKRWWTGSEWGTPTPEDLQRAMDARVANWVRWDWGVEAQTPTQVVMVKGHRPNHLLHLILSIITLGLWLIVWLILSIASGEKRKTISVSADGRLVES